MAPKAFKFPLMNPKGIQSKALYDTSLFYIIFDTLLSTLKLRLL